MFFIKYLFFFLPLHHKYKDNSNNKIMKRIILTLVTFALVATINAQVSIGGEIGFGTAHTHQTGSSDNSFFIKPEVEYELNDKFSLGLTLAYEYEGKTDEEHTNVWSIQPFLRYTFLEIGSFTAFVDGILNFSTAHTHQYKKNTNSAGVLIRPGIGYRLTKHISLDAHLGDGLYYSHVWNAGFEGDLNVDGTIRHKPQEKKNTNKFGFKLLSEICFGIAYDF